MPTDVTAQFTSPLMWPRLAMNVSLVDAIVIHHTVTFFLRPDATIEEEMCHIAMIDRYHRDVRGFLGFGYHFIVFPSGRSYLVTPLSQWGAHVMWENNHLWGIALAGTFTSCLPGAAQVKGTQDCVQACCDFANDRLPIVPHKFYGGTACPGRLAEILADFIPGGQEEETQMLKTVKGSGPTQFATDGLSKMGLPDKATKKVLIGLGLLDPVVREVPDQFIDWLAVPGSSGLLAALSRLKLVVD